MYRQKSNSFIIYIVIAVLIAVIVLSVILFNGNTTYPDVVTTDAQFEQMVYECASHYKTKIKFKTSLDLRNYDFDILFRKIMDTDTYIGCELYRYAYHYTYGSDGLMNVELRIDKPSRYRVFMTKLRVKQIAGHLRNLDTYDQVKAVHDYLVSTNEYNMTFDTAYNCLYVNKSACNGYAYSFYAIMEELGVGCFTPFGAYCQGGRVLAEVLSPDGKRAERVESEVPSLEAAHAVGRAFYERAKYLIDEARENIEGKL